MSNEESAFLTIDQTAKYIGVSRRTVWYWIAEGHIRAARKGRKWVRISRVAIDAFMRRADKESARHVREAKLRRRAAIIAAERQGRAVPTECVDGGAYTEAPGSPRFQGEPLVSENFGSHT
jgi:excisionase family DNA binding protein